MFAPIWIGDLRGKGSVYRKIFWARPISNFSISRPKGREIEIGDQSLAQKIFRYTDPFPLRSIQSREIIFLIPKFTVQVVFRQPRRVIANGALHLPLMSDFNECTRVPGRQGVAIIAFKQPRAAPVCSGPAEMESLVDFTQPQKIIHNWSLARMLF